MGYGARDRNKVECLDMSSRSYLRGNGCAEGECHGACMHLYAILLLLLSNLWMEVAEIGASSGGISVGKAF